MENLRSKSLEEFCLYSILVRDREFIDCDFQPDDFYYPVHRRIFKSMQSINADGHGIDAVSVHDSLTVDGNLEAQKAAGRIALGEIDGRHWDNHASRLKEFTRRRKIHLVGDVANRLASGDIKTSDEALGEAYRTLMDIGSDNAQRSASDVAKDSWKRVELAQAGKSMTYVPTGIKGFDKYSELPRNLTIIAAGPSQGKTTFMVNLCVSLASQGLKVGVLALEDSIEHVSDSIMTCLAGVNNRKISREKMLNEAELQRTHEACDMMSKLEGKLFFRDKPQTTKTLVSYCTQFIAQEELDVLMVDHLQKVAPDKDKEAHRDIGQCVSGIQDIAKGRIPIVLFAQTSRKISERPGRWPIMTDLADSASMERLARLIVFINRPEDYDIQEGKKPANCDRSHMYLKFTKATAGGVKGIATLGIKPESSTIFECRCREGIECGDLDSEDVAATKRQKQVKQTLPEIDF